MNCLLSDAVFLPVSGGRAGSNRKVLGSIPNLGWDLSTGSFGEPIPSRPDPSELIPRSLLGRLINAGVFA